MDHYSNNKKVSEKSSPHIPGYHHSHNQFYQHLPQLTSNMSSNRPPDNMDSQNTSAAAALLTNNSSRKSFPDLNNVSFSSSVSGSIQVCVLLTIPFYILLYFISFYLNFIVL